MNRRREFEARGSSDVALGLRSTTGTANIHLHQVVGGVATVLGVAAMHTAFEKSGEETLVPNNSAGTVGVYGFGQVDTAGGSSPAALATTIAASPTRPTRRSPSTPERATTPR